MDFDPKTGGLKCPYCGTEQALPAENAPAPAENVLDAYLHPDGSQLRRLSAAALQATCSSCGGTITFEPPQVAGSCPFCGAKIVAQAVAADPLIAPEGVLPFAITRKQATGSIQQWLSSRWFAPNALKRMARQNGIDGVYLPFWTYDAQTYTRYNGQRGEHYWETETYTETDSEGRTVRKERRVMKTRWYSASGRVDRFFDDVLIAASQTIPEGRLDALEPWDLDALRPYDPAYLSGFKAQRYQVELPQGFDRAKEAMAPVIADDIRRDIGGDEQRILSSDTRYVAITFKHLLLPIWIAAYRFESKVYQVIVNARTGEVQGERPYSIWKIALLIVAILIVVAAIYFLRDGGGGQPSFSGGS
jgi:predicted RNA-binding Zn-ribbon protein involved in translation (DUF1610 family)